MQWKPKRGRGRPPKKSTIAKMLLGGYSSVKEMREAEKKRKKLKRVM